MFDREGFNPERRDVIKHCLQALMLAGGGYSILACEREDPNIKAPSPAPKEVPEGYEALNVVSEPARKFNYHASTLEVNKKEFPMWEKSQFCASCRNYAAVDNGYGKCKLIPTEALVYSRGWCSGWRERADT